MKNEISLPSVPAGFTADSWPLFVVNGLRARCEFSMGDPQDALAGTICQALDFVTDGGALLWCGMVPDGTKFVGAALDRDGDERPFVVTVIDGIWSVDVTVAEFKMPRGFKSALKAVSADPLGSAACANPAYVPAAMAHYGLA